MDLRQTIELDTADTVENDFGLPVILFSNTGNKISTSLNKPGTPLLGQILWDTIDVNPETGGVMIVPKPNITLRASSLSEVPDENNYRLWNVQIWKSLIDHTLKTWAIKIPKHGKSLGTITLFLENLAQV